ncbi:Phenylalanine--tRNA ligase alpha subunit [uncultured archaeon]|nr:Phenylalanine--tRNA ligase alpha subunit [uncultured archaeon]
MEENKLLESLSPIERKVLPHISGKTTLNEVAKKSDVDTTTALRALEFLKNKNLVSVDSSEKKLIVPGLNGIYYLKKGLPERRLLLALAEKKSVPLGELANVSDLNENEAKVSLGTLKKKALVEIKEGRAVLTANEKEIEKESLEEKFLKTLPREMDSLEPEEKLSLENLKSRKEIIEFKTEKIVTVELTESGKKISKEDLKEDLLEQLTPKIIASESWKGKKFRRYDITSPVPRIYGGKRHFVNQSIEYCKKIWTDLGFKEMEGPKADSSFWIFDVLFTAQDHPVREMQDTFFIKNVKAKLPNKKLVEETKKSHEQGVGGSKGWKYKWNEDISKKVVLRTHTTGLSAHTLANLKKEDMPAKFFALGKVFRNETVDWKHGFEFYQTEGIVVDENANFRNLLGYLKEFYKKMGFEKIKFVPSFFPYTEPSVEIQVWHSERKEWIELGGAGIFRPELTIPLLGKAVPVLAWGQGFDRIIMDAYKIKDLRELYSNDIKVLREKPFWSK